jgi:hypothetical protein
MIGITNRRIIFVISYTASARSVVFSDSGIILFIGHLLSESSQYWKQFHGGFFKKGKLEITDDADFLKWLSLQEFLGVKQGHLLKVLDKEMRNLDAFFGMKYSFLMFVYLR